MGWGAIYFGLAQALEVEPQARDILEKHSRYPP
jgi:hypothetical protein